MNQVKRLLLATGTALVLVAPTLAQNRECNGAGATLFVDFFRDQRHTNEVIDWDLDGTVIIDIDQNGVPDDRDDMAPNTPNPGFLDSAFMVFQYRSVGSVEGLSEFITFQLTGDLPESVPSERGMVNRLDFAVTGNVTWAGTPGSCTDDTDGDGTPNGSGTPECPDSIDFGNTDSPVLPSTQGPQGLAPWYTEPGLVGYGWNPETSHGDPAWGQTGESNYLASLWRDLDADGTVDAGELLNTNTANPDAYTVYEETISFSPICYIANRGTCLDIDYDGTEDGAIRLTDLQHLMVTGRMANGMNYAANCRDVGSGTRNGMMISSGIDPSFGVGDAVGIRINQTVPNPQFPIPRAWTNLGPAHQVSNCGSSSISENAVQMRRNCIGYTGVAGGSRAVQDAIAGRYEILSVVRDVDFDADGTVGDYANPAHRVRPTLDAILDNADERTGWRLGAIQTFSTRGSPHGTDIDVNFDGTIDFPAVDLNAFPMDNHRAAIYVRNIRLGIENFEANPGGTENSRNPGDYLARNFFLTAACDVIPTADRPAVFEPGADFDQSIQDFTRDNSFLVTNPTPPYGDDDNGTIRPAGLVPVRIANPDFNGDGTADGYSDGSLNGSYRYDADADGTIETGEELAGGTTRLGQRNRCAGDFNNDGICDNRDIAKMMEALQDHQAGTPFEPGIVHPGNAGSQAKNVCIVQVIGDLDGDGNFDAADVRYMADGYAVDSVTHKINRRQNFTDVDNAWGALTGDFNFFNTAWFDARTYQPGDSARDVAGNAFVTRGASPVGHDGVIDADDDAYVLAQIAAGDLDGDGMAEWAILDEAANFDLSADTNGDLIVDVNDLSVTTPCQPCDTDCNGTINGQDIDDFINVLNGGPGCSPCAADADENGSTNGQDIDDFIDCLANP